MWPPFEACAAGRLHAKDVGEELTPHERVPAERVEVVQRLLQQQALLAHSQKPLRVSHELRHQLGVTMRHGGGDYICVDKGVPSK